MIGRTTMTTDRQRVTYSTANNSTRQAGASLVETPSSLSLADRIAANNAAAAAAAVGGGVMARSPTTSNTVSNLRNLNAQTKNTQPISAYEKMPTPLYRNINYLNQSNAVPGTVSRLNTSSQNNNSANKMPVDPSSINISSAYNHSQTSSLFGNPDRNRVLAKYTPAAKPTSSNIDERFGKLSMGGSESISANSYGLESRTNGVSSKQPMAGSTNKYASSQFHPASVGYNTTSSSSTSYMSPSLSITSSSSTSNTSLGYTSNGYTNKYRTESSAYNEPSSSSSNDMEYRGIVGLKNLGNTCYMNSVIQCLSNTRFLSEYVLSDEYNRDLNKSLSKMKGQLFTAYANLIKTMWKSSANSVVSPSDLKLNIAKYAHRFQNYAQEDAEEFFIFLLNGLSDDTNLVQKKPTPVKFDEKAWDNLSDSDKSRDQWSRFLSLERSKISDMFTGQFRSTLKCTKCGYKSVTFDTFWDVNVPMAKKSMRLEDCLRLFIDEEVIDGTEKPLCQKCKDRNVFTKRFTIERLPKILVIHLKRFLFTPYSYKISTNVDYPIEGLDVSKYLSSSVDPNISTNRAADECNRNCIYDLYAISLHSGHSQSSGHYYAYCRHPFSNRWYNYNDSLVRPIAPSSLQDADAYILFYQQRS